MRVASQTKILRRFSIGGGDPDGDPPCTEASAIAPNGDSSSSTAAAAAAAAASSNALWPPAASMDVF